MIGSTDSHTSLSTAEEDNFFGKHSGVEPEPHRWEHVVIEAPDPGLHRPRLAAGGQRPRRRLGDREHPRGDLRRHAAQGDLRHHRHPHDRALLRRLGLHARGRHLAPAGRRRLRRRACRWAATCRRRPTGKAPTFLVAALKDAHGGNLDRIQIVKGWLDAERRHPGEGLRRRLERRPPAGRGRQAAAGRQHRRRRARHLDQHHRRPRADRRLDRSRLRPGASRPSTTPGSSRSRPRAGPPTRRCASASRCPTTCR